MGLSALLKRIGTYGRRGVGFLLLLVCVWLFIHMISQKLMQLVSPNLTLKCFTMSHGNLFIWGSKGQMSRSRVTKHCRRGSLHSCECWLLELAGFYQLCARSVVHPSMLSNWCRLQGTVHREMMSFCQFWHWGGSFVGDVCHFYTPDPDFGAHVYTSCVRNAAFHPTGEPVFTRR